MRVSYDVVDVFTDRPFAGNQLAVVHGAGDFSSEQCQALAREFNYSETSFPVPTADDSYALRIFTPGSEIPFAGHPTLGTAWVLRSLGQLSDSAVTQLCGAGQIEVRFIGDRSVELSAAPRDSMRVEDSFVADLLDQLGLSAADLDGTVWAAGCGLTFVHVPVVGEAVARARLPTRPLPAYDSLPETRDPLDGINVYAAGPARDGSLDVHARVFVPGLSVPEDPATGSAAAGLGIALVETARLPEGGTYDIRQGVEMGRPSRLHGRVEIDEEGRPSRCRVAGEVHPVARGEIVVPHT